MRRNTVYFQSHRGGLLERPENTMSAYNFSWDIRGAIPEIDVRTTADGVMVCMHDNHLQRTSKAPVFIRYKKVSRLNFNELLKADPGIKFDKSFSGEHIPTLMEVFAELQNDRRRQIYLDVKDLVHTELQKKVAEYDVEKQIIFVHGDINQCKLLKELFPGSGTMTWLSGKIKIRDKGFRNLVKDNFRGLSQIQLHLHAKKVKGKIIYDFDDNFLLSAINLTKDHNVTFMVRPFIVDVDSLSHLLSLGINWFVTDEPAFFDNLIEEICIK